MRDLTLPQDRVFIAARIPHAGAMCLLDALLACDERAIRCEARTHLDPANPLRAGGRLGAACAVEYAAQAMALHARLLDADGDGPRGGMLAAVRELRLLAERLDDAPGALRIDCRRLDGGALALAYEFEVSAAGRALATGRATLVTGDGARPAPATPR